ncbi:hypothetical protein [Paenibacillus gorillae]|uniref:hypothetical protein n=1 Tax=Paenibacillus gorillae TaxID=1243662 RepID=UPI0012DCB56F|nr:hypothetical protein [Paenibacillus gorillae]
MKSDIDFHMWFTFEEHCQGKHYIVGNPHTFHGRILAYCSEKDVFFNVSLSEINEMSLQTKYWIKGYLSGNEPSPPVDEEGDVFPPAHVANIHYENSISLFHKTGSWYSGERNCTVCGTKLLHSWIGIECEDCID